MKEINTEILIIGSGLVGLVAAHALSVLNYNVTVVEKKNTLSQKNSFKDTRTVAVSEGSKRFLDNLNLWRLLDSFAEPIKTIKVYDRSPNNKIIFANKRQNEKLGYVIQNSKFSNILFNNLKKFKNTKVLFGQNVIKIDTRENFSTTFSVNYRIKSKLIIAADGKNSNIKKIVGNKTYNKSYSENALVVNLTHKNDLNNTAYEIFYKTGPLAILPIKSFGAANKSTIIWSNKPAFINKLTNSNKKFFLNFMEEKIGSIVGKIIKINSTQTFPLSAHINDSFIGERLVYVGDSAHSIHPIAGQGWNIGVNDVKNLYEISKSNKSNIGSEIFCKKYNSLSYNKAFQLYQITDKLNSHFKNNFLPSRFLSHRGFSLIESNQFIKNKISEYAMGI